MLFMSGMPTLQTLDRYLLKRFFSIYGANLLSFTVVFALIDALCNYEKLARDTGGFLEFLGSCFKYYTAIIPVIFCQILAPVITVSAGLFAVTTLQRNNEFAPILVAGRSYQRTLLPILHASIAVSLAVFLIQELWIPRTTSAIREVVEDREGVDIDRNVKHLDRHGNLIIFREYETYRRKARGILVLPVSRAGEGQFFIQAKSAEWRVPEVTGRGGLGGYWLLTDGRVQEYDKDSRLVVREPPVEWPDGTPRLYETFVERKLDSDLIPEDIAVRRQETNYMSLGALRQKAATSPDQNLWTIKYLSRFVYAATNFILVLLGLPVVIHFGTRNILFGALLTLAICASYFVANSVCQDMGIQGHIPARLAAGLAPLGFTALGATMYRSLRS
jgi:lipopolysaccharide export LptBFGC system permease protein LptF